MKFTNIERLLPFGYLLFVVLGLIKESVFYYQLNINILNYSTLSDILISPIADLTSQPIILCACFFYILMVYVVMYCFIKKRKKNTILKLIKVDIEQTNLTNDEIKILLGNKFIAISVVCIICFFLGIGLGHGNRVTNRIKENNIRYQNFLHLNDDTTKDIYIIGANTSNIIYLEKGNNNIQISPIGTVKSIEFKPEQ